MASSTITVRVDNDLKQRAECLFESVGINTTTAITMFFKEALRENRIPFELKVNSDPFYSDENMEHWARALEQFKNRGGTRPDLIEVQVVDK